MAIPILSLMGHHRAALTLIGVVLVEALILVGNRMRRPLTAVAARYTDDRSDNFDIYLPVWLARHNKLISGLIFVAGVVITLAATL